MDKKIRPQDDFYNFVNKDWCDGACLPPGYSSWGSFEKLSKKAVTDVNNLIDKLAASSSLTSDQSRIVNTYKNYLNYDARNKAGLTPIQDVLNEVETLTDKKDFTDFWLKWIKNIVFHFSTQKGLIQILKIVTLEQLLSTLWVWVWVIKTFMTQLTQDI
nr:M13 family metallopeptidase N-terminal domain-containing protein [Spiroplasma clarkii]